MYSTINDILAEAIRLKASDIHLHVDKVPLFRIGNNLEPSIYLTSRITSHNMQNIIRNTLPAFDNEIFHQAGSMDFSAEINSTRCRINLYKELTGFAMAIRILKGSISSMKELRIPQSVQNLTSKTSGLIIFSGPTGSGKSTSIASFLDSINKQYCKHIITIEDPIEYIHLTKKSLFSQREIGSHCTSFSSGLKAALREDPDIILIGELRDQDTVQTALTAAESGHLVITSLHSSNAIEAIDRVVQYFPSSLNNQIHALLANSLSAIVCQRLVARASSSELIAAYEVLHNNRIVRNLIRQGAIHKIPEWMTRDGMQTMEQSMTGLRELGLID